MEIIKGTAIQSKAYNYKGDWEGRCNNILWTCKNPDCDYRYIEKTTLECPECGERRRFCANYPSQGRDKCKYHGGHTLMGAASPVYKGRGLSKNLPTRLMEQYERSIDDPDVLNMTPEIAILESRLEDLISKSSDQPGSSVWATLQKTYTKFRTASRDAEVRKYLNELDELITQGNLEASVWVDIRLVTEQMRKLKDSERKRRIEAETIITEQQFRTILGYIVHSIQTRVKDNDVKMALLADLTKLSVNNEN